MTMDGTAGVSLRAADQKSVLALLDVGRRLGDLLTLIETGQSLESIDDTESLGNAILGRIKATQRLASRNAIEVAKAAGFPLPDLIEAICPGMPRAR